MTTLWQGDELGHKIDAGCQSAVVATAVGDVWVKPESILNVCRLLKDDSELQFDLLVSLTAVDYTDYFEVVYRLRSLPHNTMAVIKAKVGIGRTDPQLESVYSVWRGADLMEREAWDLMGVEFKNHPNLKRIMLWEGFPGHPLRKDFLHYEQSFVEQE